MNKPFLKWAGGKYRVLPQLLPLIGNPKRYCEPFAGSLATALNVESDEYILNDLNSDIINLYNYLIDSPTFISEGEEYFGEHTNQKDVFYRQRNYFNNGADLKHKAILFVYLNRHCFNGLTRYNKKGGFNVPFGKNSKPYYPKIEMENFREYFSTKNVQFTTHSFEDDSLYQNLEHGDVVYFDPPYIPISVTSGFTNYTGEDFTYEQQVELVELSIRLNDKGIKVIISNHDVPLARELYKNAKIYELQVSRSIAAKGSSRKKVNEVIAVFE